MRRDTLGFEVLEVRELLSTYTVNALTDTGAGTGTSGDLRYAITQANANAGSTIQFGVTGTIQLASSLPDLSQDVTITGPGPSSLMIEGGGSSSNFNALTVDGGVTATISDLAIDDFNLTENAGGAIYNSGTLVLGNDVISDDSASLGGGVYNDSAGSLTLDNDTLSNDSADYGGGGLENNGGSSNLTNDVVSYCSTPPSASGYYFGGGGIGNFNNGTVALTDVTVSSDSSNHGGGIANDGTLTLAGDTLSGNSATANGGALYNTGTANLVLNQA